MEYKLQLYLRACLTLTFLSALLVLLFFTFSFLPETAINKEDTPLHSREVRVNIDRGDPTLNECADLGREYIDKIVFLGESTTYGLERYGLVPKSQVWTGATYSNGSATSAGTLSLSPSIDKTKIYYSDTGEALTVGEALLRKRPEYLVITLGLNNGASYYTEDEFKECYRILLNEVLGTSESTTVILQSLFPVADVCRIKAYTPERIRLCNTWIRDLASEYGLYYLDTISALSNENGYLRSEYENGGDGIHLNGTGLEVVLTYIRTHGIQDPQEAKS